MKNINHKIPSRKITRSLAFAFALAALLIGFEGSARAAQSAPAGQTAAKSPEALPGMLPLLDQHDIYAADRPGALNATVKNYPSLVYVPNSGDGTVDVIDPKTYKVVDHFAVGKLPQHIVPSYDMKSLWVLNDEGWELTRIDPATGKKAETVKVDDPYNLYFTPEGKYAIVVAEALKRLDFREPQSMKLEHSLPVPCKGANHLDFSADGRYFVISCEFDGQVLKIDVETQKIVGTLKVDRGWQPQDVRLSPDGKVFYIADLKADGVHLIDARDLQADRLSADRQGRARAAHQPRLQVDVRVEPRRRQHLGD